MIVTVRPYMAATTYPNTPESDMQRFVLHTVTGKGSDGKEYEMKLMAQDPPDAIDKAHRIPESTLWTERK